MNWASVGGRARSVRTPSGTGPWLSLAAVPRAWVGGLASSSPPARPHLLQQWPLPPSRPVVSSLPVSVSPHPHSRFGDPLPFRTCWPLLPFLLPLLPLVQLFESLCRLLQPSHEPLNVVQGTVEDLLGSEWRRGSDFGGRDCPTHCLLVPGLGEEVGAAPGAGWRGPHPMGTPGR